MTEKLQVKQKLTQVMEKDGKKGRTSDDNGYKILRFSMGCLINILIKAGLFDKLVLTL